MEGKSITEVFGMSTKLDSILDIVKLVQFDSEQVVCKFIVDDTCINLNGSLHGGYSAMLIDVISTLAFIANDFTKAGVSVDLNSTYLSTCQVGDEVRVVAKALKVGKTLGFSTVDIIRAKDNVLICTGRHTKSFPPPREPKAKAETVPAPAAVAEAKLPAPEAPISQKAKVAQALPQKQPAAAPAAEKKPLAARSKIVRPPKRSKL